jgi:hypothetical protein
VVLVMVSLAALAPRSARQRRGRARARERGAARRGDRPAGRA